MFTNALKSFTSNITSNYTLSPSPTSQSGPWKIYDARKKKSNQSVSVWTFERKSLESSGGSNLSFRGNPRDGLKAAQDEVVERLKQEASLLARLRHPCVLELAEPVEETRGGGLMFATEPVLCSLGGLLAEKDEEETRGSVRRRTEVEIDELEIQKGLLQLGKALEFLHESAALVHGNLTPEAVMINAKSDWKLSSLSFTISSISPPLPPSFDPRLPPFVQHNLDFSAPDLTLDSSLTPSSDLFSLGLLIVSLYNHPHRSPLETHNSPSTYRRLLTSASTTPSPHNNFLSARPLPRPLLDSLLPTLLTRHPATRITAREFQQSPYFDNILVSALRFLDALPAKTPSEKAAFMRGLPKILPQFPRGVLEKKLLPGLVEELRDGSTLALVLPSVFAIVEGGNARLFQERVLPRLKEVFIEPKPSKPEREKDTGREGGLTVLLTHLDTIMDKTTAREFKDDILPIYQLALESPTHALQDLALRSLARIRPKLDFPTLKSTVFPVVASVFTKTASLGIKIRALEAFNVLCGGTPLPRGAFENQRAARKDDCPVLDKHTIQEKVVPLLKGIKTKEPAVMMAALDVFAQIGTLCDREVVAMELLPGLWTMSFGPLLGLAQFQAFMATIKFLSSKIEHEQTRKLQELGSSSTPDNDFLSFGGVPGASPRPTSTADSEFENLVFGKPTTSSATTTTTTTTWSKPPDRAETPAFSWSTPASRTPRSVTPDVNLSFKPMTPAPVRASTPSGLSISATPLTPTLGFKPMTPVPARASTPSGLSVSNAPLTPMLGNRPPQPHANIDWSSVLTPSKTVPTPSMTALTPTPALAGYGGLARQNGYSQGSGAFAGFMIPPPPPPPPPSSSSSGVGWGGSAGASASASAGGGGARKELEGWDSLL